ncbi:MAG: glycosyltransferase [Bacteroidia bacterium]|nr:glycosyltransferase [Bacteroidia bacterium]
MKILVCLPTYNEIASVGTMVERIQALGLEVFLSDGGSQDGTREKAAELGVKVVDRKGNGKGFGVQAALQYAANQKADYLALIDCDESYFPEDLPELIQFLPNFDLIVGTRPFKNITFARRLANFLLTATLDLLFFYPYKDIASGLRILKVDLFQKELDAAGFEIEPQISAVAVKRKMRIREVPIRYGERAGESKIRPVDFIWAVRQMLRDRFRK